MKHQMRNLTNRNLMEVIWKIQTKSYEQPEAERLTRSVFAEFLSCPQDMSIEERVRQILTKEEWEKECREYGC